MIRAHRDLLFLLSVALAACGPSAPADGTGGATGGHTSTSSTTTDGSFSATEQVDSSDSSGASVEFTCPGARWYEGELDIDDSTDLDALRDVGGVTGSLNIGDTTSLPDLEFLSCLEVVEGTLWIHDNDSLVSLHGLERLRVINGSSDTLGPPLNLGIQRNPALPRIDSLDSLETLGVLRVQSNESLTEIEMPALRHIELLFLGGYCGSESEPVQPLASVGSYPDLEHCESILLSGQQELTSLQSLIELADRGVVFDEARFEHNFTLPQSEIDAFAAAASITPKSCSNMDGTEECSRCPFK